MTHLYALFGKVLFSIYSIVGDYGFSIVLFALFARLLLLPLTIKQTKSSQIMQVLNPEIQLIQEKYKNDKNKQGEEMWKVYEKYNYNPMSGCLPLFIQFPIIIGLFGCVRNPAEYVFIGGMGHVSLSFLWLDDLSKTAMEIIKAGGGLSAATMGALILPAIVVLFTYIQQKQQMAAQPNNMGGSMQMMNNMMILMIGWCSITFTGALALYWTATTVFTVGQTWLMQKFMPVTAESLGVSEEEQLRLRREITSGGNKNKKKRNRKK